MTSVDTPVRRTGRRRLLRAAGAVLAVLVLAVAGFAFVILRQYPAHIREPESVLGMDALDGYTEVWRKTTTSADMLPAGHSSYILRAYSTTHGANLDAIAVNGLHIDSALVYAAADLILFPRSELTAALRHWAGKWPGDPHPEIVEVPAGDLGGYAACYTDDSTGTLTYLCGWADHGSLGLVYLTYEHLGVPEPLLLEVRAAVESR